MSDKRVAETFSLLLNLEGGAGRYDQPPAVRSLRAFDAEHGSRGPMEARADAPVGFERVEVQILAAGRDLAGVIKDGDVEAGAIWNPPELGGRQQAVAIAEAPDS